MPKKCKELSQYAKDYSELYQKRRIFFGYYVLTLFFAENFLAKQIKKNDYHKKTTENSAGISVVFLMSVILKTYVKAFRKADSASANLSMSFYP